MRMMWCVVHTPDRESGIGRTGNTDSQRMDGGFMESKSPIKIHIVKKTVFSVPDKGRASKTAATEWQVWPAIQVAKPGDTFEWEIKDHQPHKLTIHLPSEF